MTGVGDVVGPDLLHEARHCVEAETPVAIGVGDPDGALRLEDPTTARAGYDRHGAECCIAYGPAVATTARTVKDRRRLRRSAVLAGVGDGVVAAALPLLAVDLTRDPLGIAGVVAAQHVPWVLVHLGWPRLRVDRRTLVGFVNTMRALVLGALGFLAVLGHETILWIQFAAFVVGLGEALTDGTESETTDVTGLSARAMLAMAAVGLPLGGLLFEIFPATPFLFEVLTFAGAGLYALLVGRPVRAPRPVDEPDDEEIPRLPGTAMLTGSAVVAGFAAAAVAGVLVLYAHDDLGLGAPAFGLLLAGLAAATTVGGIIAPDLGSRVGVQRALVAALVLAAAGHAVASRVADADRPWFGALALGVTAGAAMIASVLTRATLQLHAGRPVTATALRPFHLAVWTAIPLGALAGGWLARHRTVHEVLVWAAGAWVVAAACALLSRPAAESPEIV